MPKKRGSRFSISNSKAQAAIFIVASVAIVLLGLLYFFYQKQAVEREIQVVQPEIVPVKSYVENCMKIAAEDGLEKIGLTGGYINIQPKISNNPKTYLAPLIDSFFKMPYWWYDGIDAIPTEGFINQELRSHIKTELKGCINNFEPFAGIFEINELNEAVVDVKFNEEDVSVNLRYPLEIVAKEGDFKALAENFAYTAPIRFKKVYELAKQIMERENKDYFLERRTIDLYSIDTEIPTTDIEATCKTKTWQLANIKERLKTLLRVNIPYIRVKGTDYNQNLYVPNPDGKNIYADTYFQNNYVWEIDANAEKKYKNMKVSFAYDNWPLQIYARPSQNGVLSSNAQRGTNMLSFLCLHIWHFTYDINYPARATVFDQETKSNKAYRFSFAFKAAIEHNQPNRVNKGSTLFEAIPDISTDEYCNDVQNEITIFTVDNATGEDIKDVNLTFVCGRYYCNMGKTDFLSFGAAAGIAKRLPYCINGIIKGIKKGYADAQQFIQTDADKAYVLLLNPVKELNYNVVKHSLSNPGIAKELEQNEKASITIKGNETGFEAFAVYPREGGFTLTLPDGKDAAYEVNIYLADDENLIGGYIGKWEISKDTLRDAQEVVFHVIEQKKATEDERLLFLLGLSSYSKNVQAPELK